VDPILDNYQRELETHFKSVAAQRDAEGLPVFAIEHGLDAQAVSALGDRLRQSLVRDDRLSPHWLLWVIYATELGYDYDGQEYWPSFEQRTPRWRLQIDRRQSLRQWFLRFHKSYRGARPAGPWATQFSIISWPITHAILPKDLQGQLAKILYEERYSIAQFANESPEEVGNLIAASAYDASARLRNFLEQPELAGRIILGLLAPSGETSNRWLQDGTIRRILADLEKQRQAKVWLQETRSTIDSVKLKLASQARFPVDSQAINRFQETKSDRVAVKSVTPQLLLFRERQDDWVPFVEIPSFDSIAKLNPRLATLLRSSRAKVLGTAGAWSAPGWLLYGPYRKRLTSWPEPSKSLIQIDKADTGLQYILDGECHITAGPSWLFRLRPDGTAVQVPNRVVQLDTEYILLRSNASETGEFFRTLRTDSAGISLTEIKVTSSTPPEALRILATLDVGIERFLRIWPVGTPPRRWAVDGSVEWLSHESPIIGVSHDGSCQSLSMRVGQQAAIPITPRTDGQPVFASIGQLPIGVHSLSVTAQHKIDEQGAVGRIVTSHAKLSILIRRPHAWVPGSVSHRGFIVSCERLEPTLDGLLAGQVAISVAGPTGRNVDCRLELLDGSGKVLSSDHIGSVRLPANRATCAALLTRHLENLKDPYHYSTASGSRLVIDGDELGTFRVVLKHTLSPLRWYARGSKTLEIQLIDDGDRETPATVSFSSFECAGVARKAEFAAESNSLVPDGQGGLYVAECGGLRACIVASAWIKAGLDGLAVHPSLQMDLGQNGALARLLESIKDWSRARAFGPLANQRREIVVADLQAYLFAYMCGRRWASYEKRLRADGVSSDLQRCLEEAVYKNVSFGIALSNNKNQIVTDSFVESCERFHRQAARFQVCGDPELSSTALGLAARPATIAELLGPTSSEKITALQTMPELVRAARLLVVLSDGMSKEKIEKWAP
jgi:hypothetical protein